MTVWTTQLEMKVEAVQTGTAEWEYKEMKWYEIFGRGKIMKGCEAEFLEPTFSWMAFNFRYLSWKKNPKQPKSQLGRRPSYSESVENQPLFKFGDGCIITETSQIILSSECNWMNTASWSNFTVSELAVKDLEILDHWKLLSFRSWKLLSSKHTISLEK